MSEPLVIARNVTKTFESKVALDNVSAEVFPGDIIGVLGKNGAGKTTLLETVLGFSPPTQGSTTVFGENSLELSAAAKARIGFVPQQDELLGVLNGGQLLAIVASFHADWGREFIARLVAEWGVRLDQRIATLSVGERQKLSVLAALGHHPDLLVLDEPVASLDPIARRQFLEQIIDVTADGTRSVILSSHIVSDIERLANKIWILKDHRLFWHGDFDALKESIVRVHIRATRPLPAALAIRNALSLHVDATTATAVVRDWDSALTESLGAELDAEIEVEPLGLEDIFLELHR